MEYDELVIKVNNTSTTDTSNLVKKTEYNTNINEIEKKISYHDYAKYITIQQYNKLTAENFIARLAQANLANNWNWNCWFCKLKNLNKRVTLNKTKHVLVENDLN